MKSTIIPKAIIDANVLYPASIRDLLLNIAALNLFQPFWSDRIHNEWIRNLLKNRKDLKKVSLLRTVKLMNKAFPYANIENYSNKHIEQSLPDPNDEHVILAAIKANCDFVITENTKDFPSSILKLYGLEPITPDQFIAYLSKDNIGEIKIAFENMIANLKNPPLSKIKMLEILKKQRMKLSVKLLSI